MTDIKKVLEYHAEWLLNSTKGCRANLSGADLTGADLTRADLIGANLSGANLTGADLTRADLTRAYLIGANLIGANLSGADLTRADLTRAYLSGAKNIYTFGPMQTSKRICHAVWHGEEKGWLVQAGCFWGSLDELEKVVMERHSCPVYLANIALLRAYKPE